MTEPIGRERNAQLLKKAKDGDKEAVETLIRENEGLVHTVVRRFQGRGTETEDLYEIGMCGMLKAIRGYDPSYETAFSTYAVPLIIGEIRKFFRDDGMIKVSRDTKRKAAEILRIREKIQKESGREPTTDELAAQSGTDRETLLYCLDAVSPVRSLSEPINEVDEDVTLGSVLADDDGAFETLIDRMMLGQAFRQLDRQDRKLLELRYRRELSQVQTAAILGVSQVKVSRMERKIIEKLRKVMTS